MPEALAYERVVDQSRRPTESVTCVGVQIVGRRTRVGQKSSADRIGSPDGSSHRVASRWSRGAVCLGRSVGLIESLPSKSVDRFGRPTMSPCHGRPNWSLCCVSGWKSSAARSGSLCACRQQPITTDPLHLVNLDEFSSKSRKRSQRKSAS
jgi:hypothetical protein